MRNGYEDRAPIRSDLATEVNRWLRNVLPNTGEQRVDVGALSHLSRDELLIRVRHLRAFDYDRGHTEVPKRFQVPRTVYRRSFRCSTMIRLKAMGGPRLTPPRYCGGAFGEGRTVRGRATRQS